MDDGGKETMVEVVLGTGVVVIASYENGYGVEIAL